LGVIGLRYGNPVRDQPGRFVHRAGIRHRHGWLSSSTLVPGLRYRRVSCWPGASPAEAGALPGMWKVPSRNRKYAEEP